MGTLLNRRRYMGGAKEQGYIQDGLVFWLDGIDKGENEGYWTDLKGGCQFTIPASGVTTLTNGFEWTSKTPMPLDSGEIPKGAGVTVEIVLVKKTGTSNPAIIFASDKQAPSNAVGISLTNNSIVFLQRCRQMSISLSLDTLYRLSYNTDVCAANEEQKNTTGTDYWSADTIGIGTCGSGRGIIGIIHSIRIYNRKLSLAEMINNQKYDLVRFG